MKLLFRRSQRTGIFSGKTIFVLDLRAEFAEEELLAIDRYDLTGELLFTRGEIVEPGYGLLGFASRLAFHALNSSLTVGELADGKRIECTDIVEALATEDHIRESAETLRRVLLAAAQYEGEEIVEL